MSYSFTPRARRFSFGVVADPSTGDEVAGDSAQTRIVVYTEGSTAELTRQNLADAYDTDDGLNLNILRARLFRQVWPLHMTGWAFPLSPSPT